MMFGYATRHEFDSLAERVAEMDAGGTRGMGGVQVQVGNLIADVTELKVKMDAHEQGHAREATARAAERVEARRYAITTAIAAVATLIAMITLLAVHVH